MSAPNSNAQNPPTIAASQTATPATASSPGAANVAAGSAPTARSYASATKKASSPPIASSAAPLVAVGGQNPQHGKSSSISPVNGKGPIQPAVPAMAPTIVNSSNVNGDHSRKPSVTISASGTSGYIPNGGPVANRPPSGLTFLAQSPQPPHAIPNPQGANLNPTPPNPRIASPSHSPSPIPQYSGGKLNNLPGGPRPEIAFGGPASEGAEQNARPNMPHNRSQSNQSSHSDLNNQHFNNRGYPPQAGRGRGNNFGPGFAQHNSPQPYRAMPAHAGRGMPASFQPQGGMHPNSPFRQPATLAQQPMQYPSGPYMHNYPQPVRIPISHKSRHSSFVPEYRMSTPSADSFQSSLPLSQFNVPSMATSNTAEFRMPADGDNGFLRSISPSFSVNLCVDQSLTEMQQQNMYGVPHMDAYGQYYPQQQFGLQNSMYAPPVPPSPRMGYPMPGAPYGQPQAAPGMSRSPSNMSERPSSAVAQPSTPAMTNVNHVSHTHTPSSVANSPAPNSTNFTKPPKTSKAIVIKNADGEVVNFDKKAASPAPPAQPRSPAIVSTPTPPPRVPSAAGSSHSRTESVLAKTDKEKQAEFVKQFQEKLRLDKEKEENDKKEREEAEAKAQKEKEEAEAKAQKEKEETEAKAKEEAEKAAREKEEAEAAEKAKAEEEEKKRREDEEMEKWIAELEAQEKEEAAKEAAYQEKKAKEAEEQKKREAENIRLEEEKLRQQEKEAEERELARLNETAEQKAERENLFASLKKNTMFGPGANGSGSSTPTAEPTPPAPSKSPQPRAPGQPKPKPAALQLDTKKTVEPPQPTAGMQSLKSARFLQIKNEAINYPEGIRSPNPALNVSSRSKGRQYDKEFLLQFQEVFKEKPSVDWDMKLKETVGDSSDSARPQSARPSMGMGGRQPSARGPVGAMGQFGAFAGARTLPPGTTSEQRFQQASGFNKPNPIAPFIGGNRGGAFPIAPPMARQNSFQPSSPRVGSSSRGRGSRRGGENKKEEQKNNNAMPLTANMELKPLERSQTGWKPISISASAPAQPAAGHMPPDMVQRKVKAALNKMTPEKFDKIADQILEIAAQSAQENDGRTLRQVIALTFEKACDEAHWASMYAKFCQRMLATMSTDIKDENVTDKHGQPVVGGALFRKYLLNRCQEEFERGWEVNLPEKPEGQSDEAATMLSDEYYIAAAAKRKGLGLIQFIGELYKLGMLTLRIMHECVLKLLDFEGLPDESAIESLVKLLRTVGATMENTDTGPKMIAMYFERIEKIMKMEGLPSRLQFMLLDTIDLRKAGWKSKDDAKGPKTISEIRQEAAAAQQAAEMERTRSNQRGGPRPPMGRGDARSFSGGGMMPPPDYPSGRVQMDDLRKLSKGASGRSINGPSQLGPSMLGARSGSGRRGLGPSGLGPRGDESGASSRTATPPQKEKESTTHMNSFSALAALENEGAGEVGSPPSTASSPPVRKATAVEKEA